MSIPYPNEPWRRVLGNIFDGVAVWGSVLYGTSQSAIVNLDIGELQESSSVVLATVARKNITFRARDITCGFNWPSCYAFGSFIGWWH